MCARSGIKLATFTRAVSRCGGLLTKDIALNRLQANFGPVHHNRHLRNLYTLPPEFGSSVVASRTKSICRFTPLSLDLLVLNY